MVGRPERHFGYERGDAYERTRRDLERYQKRQPSGRFWQSLALIGSVGWPIVLLATGGALLGHYLDSRFETGVRLTLMLLSIGTLAGALIAYRSLRAGDR